MSANEWPVVLSDLSHGDRADSKNWHDHEVNTDKNSDCFWIIAGILLIIDVRKHHGSERRSRCSGISSAANGGPGLRQLNFKKPPLSLQFNRRNSQFTPLQHGHLKGNLVHIRLGNNVFRHAPHDKITYFFAPAFFRKLTMSV